MTESEKSIKSTLNRMTRSDDSGVRAFAKELRALVKRLNLERTEKFNALYEKNKEEKEREFNKGVEYGRKNK
jgi:hypothetical protein